MGVVVGTVAAEVVETGYREAEVEEVAKAWVVGTMSWLAEVRGGCGGRGCGREQLLVGDLWVKPLLG